MNKESYLFKLFPLIITFIAIPLILWNIGNFPRRNALMETLSIMTILGFALLLSQFFFSRINKSLVMDIRMVNVLSIHKFIGYVFVSILLLHPFFIIVPKIFDSGLNPGDAFIELITAVGSLGVVLGMIAYTIMLILLVTAFFRFKLHLKYTTWRNLHAYLAVFFVLTATLHVIKLGRHSNIAFKIYYVLMVVSGIYYLLKTYLFKPSK